jgi:glycosyltransferase involved in cell wall biosynthesis
MSPLTRQRVLTVGHLSEAQLRAAMQSASVLAYPSQFEGFGLPPLEAMASGVPVVAADTEAVRESCGNAALYAPSDNPEQWAAVLHNVLTDEEKAGELREIGRRRSAEFTWQRCAEQTLDLYDRICGRR